MRFINAGFGNLLAVERIVSAASPDSAPIRRLVQDAKENGSAIDLACGRKCRAVIICDSGHVVLSALTVEMLSARLEKTGVAVSTGIAVSAGTADSAADTNTDAPTGAIAEDADDARPTEKPRPL